MEEPLHSSSKDEEFEHDPFRRRFWLLRQALKSGSYMAEALKIAQEIEAFLAWIIREGAQDFGLGRRRGAFFRGVGDAVI